MAPCRSRRPPRPPLPAPPVPPPPSAARPSPAGSPAASPTATPDHGRLLLLDGHSLAYRAFFAIPADTMMTSTGQPTNAVFGFTSMLINLLRDEQPTHIAVAFDLSAPTFRHEAYAEYKATRSATPDDFRSQMSLIHEVL